MNDQQRTWSRCSRLLAVVIAGVLMTVSSCAGEQQEKASDEREATPSLASSSPGLAIVSWREWEPQTVVTPRSYTEEQALSLRQEALERERPAAAAGLPVPDLVAWSRSDEEIAACMTEEGFPTRVIDPSGGLDSDEPNPSQRDQQEVAWWTCWARYTHEPEQLAPRTSDYHRVLYEYYTSYYLPCLAREGLVLPTAGIPSKEAWVASVQADGGEGTWMPTTDWPEDVRRAWGRMTPERQDAVMQTCPAGPPLRALFGE